MELDLRQILRFTRRWWWLLLLAPVLAGFTARYVRLQRAVPESALTYTTSATLLINPVPGTGRLAYRAETYAGLALTDPVLTRVVADLNLPFSAPTLKQLITVSPIVNTELLTLAVTDTDPERAAAIANAVAARFAESMSSQGSELAGQTRVTLEQQTTTMQGEIDALTIRIRDLEQDGNPDDAVEQEQVSALRAELERRQQSLVLLEEDLQQVDLNIAAAQPQISVAEEAPVPMFPNDDAAGIPIIPLATIAGLLIAIAALVLVELMDTSVKAGTEVTSLTGASVLSTLPNVRGLRTPTERLFVVKRSVTPAAESIRLLRTNINIERASWSPPGKILVISSATLSEGKSIVAANLAAAMAQVGLRTVLIDADLRRPIQHSIFDVSNKRGLSTLLNRPEASLEASLNEEMIDSNIANLSIIPSGPLPSNPADLLSMGRLGALLGQLRERVDIVVIDTPPVLAVSDSISVAAHADGVVLVCRFGRTSEGALGRAANVLRQGSVRLIGVVLNGRSRWDGMEGQSDYMNNYGWELTTEVPSATATSFQNAHEHR